MNALYISPTLRSLTVELLGLLVESRMSLFFTLCTEVGRIGEVCSTPVLCLVVC